MNRMKWVGFGALVLLGVTGCASGKPTPEQEAARQAAAETIDQILTTPLATEEYAKPVRCLSTFEYDEMDVLDDQHVLFKGTGDRMWLNKLRNRCVGLNTHSTPVIRLRNAQVCNLDTFQAMETVIGGWMRTSATCSLGEFVPVTPEQAKAIEAAIKESRQK